MATESLLLVGMAVLGVGALAVQAFNLVARRVRIGVTAGCILCAALALLLARDPEVNFGAFVATLIVLTMLQRKWDVEVGNDIQARKEAGEPPLLPGASKQYHWVMPFVVSRYRRRLFRDPESRRRLLQMSVAVPPWLTDNTVERSGRIEM